MKDTFDKLSKFNHDEILSIIAIEIAEQNRLKREELKILCHIHNINTDSVDLIPKEQNEV
jgi:hypothetical protein